MIGSIQFKATKTLYSVSETHVNRKTAIAIRQADQASPDFSSLIFDTFALGPFDKKIWRAYITAGNSHYQSYDRLSDLLDLLMLATPNSLRSCNL